jgi:hypothetical protein
MAMLNTFVSLIIVAALFLTMVIPKMVRYIVNGLALLSIGVLTLLFNYGYIQFNIGNYPIFNYAVFFLTVFAGKRLLKDGFVSQEKHIKFPSIIFGISIIVITTVPTLHKLGVIDFVLTYPSVINHFLYVIAGIVLIIGAFIIVPRLPAKK